MSEAVNNNIQEMMQGIGRSARVASRAMARASAEQKNEALLHIAKLVREKATEIQKVNQLT
jgi:glutamate-5-semialdehyde dehydrogenase